MLIGIALHQFADISKYDRHTLGNYDAYMMQIEMMAVPACIVIVATLVLGVVTLIKIPFNVLKWFRRGYGVMLLIFSVVLVTLAVRMTRSNTGEGAGLIIIITGPMILFALLIPPALGTIALVSTRKPNISVKPEANDLKCCPVCGNPFSIFDRVSQPKMCARCFKSEAARRQVLPLAKERRVEDPPAT